VGDPFPERNRFLQDELPVQIKSRGHGDKLPRKGKAAVLALLTEPTVREAADKVGIKVQTLCEWMKLPEFVELWQRASSEAFEHGLKRLQSVTSLTVEVLEEALRNGNRIERLRAAAIVMSHVLRVYELREMEEADQRREKRIAALEERQRQSTNGKVAHYAPAQG
jgi:hypothetical protein